LNDRKQEPDPGNPLNYAPRRLRDPDHQTDPATAELEKVEQALSALRTPYENLAPLPPISVQDLPPISVEDLPPIIRAQDLPPVIRAQDLPPVRTQQPPPVRAQGLRDERQPNIFAEALARAEREQLERELDDVPELLPERPSLHIVTKFVIAVCAAALGALTYVVVFPDSQALIESNAPSGLSTTWQELKSALFPASLPKLTPTLMVRDNSGSINQLLEFGVNVVDPSPGMTVIIRKMPPGTKLTAGTPVTASEWHVPAEQISDAVITPPRDFVGEMNLSAELRGADEATLVTASVRLTWAAPSAGAAVTAASATNVAVTAVPAVSVAVAAAPALPPPAQLPQLVAPPAAAEVTLPPPPVPPPPARAELNQDFSPNEIAGFVRRAQELLASGDLQGARTQLMRAASARDPRAALLLAKTFDPTALRQYGAVDPEPDLAQARNWYQRAREWGSPEAQRQLDALASYPRR
jgi:hypothetical protein